MKNLVLVSAAAVALALLGGCATMAADPTSQAAAGGLNVYYDGHYGPLTSGYWSVDNSFYYRDATGAFVKDYDGHVQRSAGVGYTLTHVEKGR